MAVGYKKLWKPLIDRKMKKYKYWKNKQGKTNEKAGKKVARKGMEDFIFYTCI